jgi:hypothetical protein
MSAFGFARSRRAATLLLVALGIVGLVLVSGPLPAAAREPVRPGLGVGPAHWFGRGAYGSFGKTPARLSAGFSSVDNLANPGNGEIMPTTNTYVVFWLPAGFHYSAGTTAASDLSYENTVLKYFPDVGGSQILNTTTQYAGNNGTPSDTSTFKTSIVDTTAFPDTGADVAHAITQTDLNNEIFNQINNHSWPLGLSTMYFIFLPDNLVDCNDAKTKCNTNVYCAYHTYGFSGSDTPANDFIWADIPDDRSIYEIGGCGDSNVTGNESADTTLSSVEHEHMEAITDPRLNAWQDSTGGAGENGDKCNRNMGVANASSTTPNNYLGAGNTDKFRIQREWSNAAGGGGCAASYTTTGSHVESPAPSGGDVTNSVSEATISGNTSDSLDYTLTFKNPSNQDDAYGVSVTVTLPSGVQSGVSSTVTYSLGDLAPHQMATRSFTAHPTVPLTAGTTLTSSAQFAFNDSTGAAQPTITRTAVTTVVNSPPVLAPLSDKSVDYHDALTIAVSATDADAGDTLSFSATGLPAGLALTDNGDRTATISGTDIAVPADYTVVVSVDDHHQVSPTSATFTIHVLREETTLKYNGQTAILLGSGGATLTAVLAEDGANDNDSDGGAAAPDVKRAVTLSLDGQSCAASTDASGLATCTIPLSQLSLVALGPQTVSATFAGDTLYQPSADSASAIVFAFPSSGAFVLGDTTVATAGSSTVTWWGNNWNLADSLSGGAAPPSFKGFAGTVTTLPTGGTEPSSCGGTWETTGGNSAPPTSGVPSYMGVLVASHVDKHGNTISGDFIHIVVVKINPGYAPNPMSAGTGTIVATYC